MKPQLLRISLSACIGALALAGCAGDEDPPPADCTLPFELTNADINGGKTLVAGSCYQVTQNLTLNDDLLTLEAGVVIEFDPDVGISVTSTGKLRIDGTMGAPVILKAADAGATWKGIRLNGSQSTDNVWTYVQLENAGSTRWTGGANSLAGLYLSSNSRLMMDNVSISGSVGYGLRTDAEAEYTFANGALDGCDTPALLALQGLSGFGGETTFTGNTKEYVELVPGSGETVSLAQTWNRIALPYRVVNRFQIAADVVIEAGSIFQFVVDSYVIVENTGSLSAVGTDAAPIILEGAEDLRGAWRGISIESRSASNVFDFVTFGNGGGDRWTGGANSTGMLYIGTEATIAVSNSIFTKSDGYAFWAGRDATIAAFENNLFTDNTNAMLLHVDRPGEMGAGNMFTGNDDDSIWLTISSGEQVSDDATWRNFGVPYKVLNRFSVGLAAATPFTLTIEPGTTVLFAEETYVTVEDDASITAVGNMDNPITFAGFQDLRGFWRGLSIESRSDANQFDYVIFGNGGADRWTGSAVSVAMVYMGTLSSSRFSNCTFRNSEGYAFFAASEAVLEDFTANTFEANALTALLHPDRIGELSSDITSAGNDDDALWVTISAGEAITKDSTWKDVGVPYKVRNRMTFGSSGATPLTVTIEPGVEIQFTEEAYLTVEDDATIIADGEAGNRIRFTGTQEIAAGFWRGISIESATANSISYADIAYGGADRWTGSAESDAHVYVATDSNITLDNVSIGPGGGHGVTVANNATATCSNMMFTGLAKSEGYDLQSATASAGCP